MQITYQIVAFYFLLPKATPILFLILRIYHLEIEVSERFENFNKIKTFSYKCLREFLKSMSDCKKS